MFGLGSGELLLVLILALIFIGPERLPEIATRFGKLVRKAKSVLDELKSTIDS